jgi:4,5-DOPA dioxygenase extradiol
MAQPMPAIFFGHGNPMNALLRNGYTEGWRRIGEQTPFEAEAKEMMLVGEYNTLIEYEKLGRDVMLSDPTPDHYLPLLYT